jgi:hypothetical protein
MPEKKTESGNTYKLATSENKIDKYTQAGISEMPKLSHDYKHPEASELLHWISEKLGLGQMDEFSGLWLPNTKASLIEWESIRKIGTAANSTQKRLVLSLGKSLWIGTDKMT